MLDKSSQRIQIMGVAAGAGNLLVSTVVFEESTPTPTSQLNRADATATKNFDFSFLFEFLWDLVFSAGA